MPIDLKHLDPQMIADLDNLGRILDETIVELGDVNEAVLVNANVYECAEVRHIGDDSFQPHPGLDIGNGLDAVGESHRLILSPWIPAGS